MAPQWHHRPQHGPRDVPAAPPGGTDGERLTLAVARTRFQACPGPGVTLAREPRVAGLLVVAVNRMPAAEVEVSADLVRRLLADQHPDLARLPVEFLANGWDNELYRVGDRLVARLPRRALGAEIIKNEQRWLPGLAPRLPLPIPYPVRTGVPGCGYPYSWSVAPYLPGVPAVQASSFDPAAAAAAVGGFLGALHVPAPADAPANPFRGVPLAQRAGTFAANLALLAGQDQVDRDAVLRAWAAALAAPGYDGPPVWLHGDLHPANVLVDDGRVSGVIDFGDITAGDPACDLSVAWMLLPLDCHARFWSAYRAAGGWASDALRARARGWALNLAIVFLAHSEDNPVLLVEADRRTLSNVLEDQRGPVG
jgi:aminoglycoside phosphotransferase (APT) family kinase protein